MSTVPGELWECPLDVSALAWESVGAAVTASRELAARRGSAGDVATTPDLIRCSFAAVERLLVDGRTPEVWAPLSGFFEAADGWVRLHGNYPHHAAAITAAYDVTERADLERVLASTPAAEIEATITGHRGIATVVRTPDEWRAHPHGAATADEPWTTTTTTRERSPLRPAGAAMEGLRVLDLTRVIAGPTCSQLLACLGADVLRVDPPQRPELLDAHLSNGMGKRSTELDLRTDAARLHELVATADVVLLGYRPGSLAPFGLDPQTLAADRPDLIIASLSAWGEGGPWAQRSGFDSIVQAASGIAVRCGSADRPGALPVQALDHASGYRMAAGVMSLLAQGRGGIVRVSLLGAARDLLAAPVVDRPLLPSTDCVVQVDSPYGPLTTVPPPITLEGRTLEQPVAGYASAPAAWA
ncbi:CoA transferase [Janibacter anophelis]|uniref:CoA transferase n=1 Tax=Janibacter anophelis TaxID=319054 RepID=UPI003F7DDFC1